MLFDSKNRNQIKENKLSNSLSKIDPNDSNEDKNQISISESNDIFNYPSPKKMLSDMTRLSKRMRKEENDIAFSNRTKAEELRTKYIPTFKSFLNDSIYRTTKKDKINFRIDNINVDKINISKNKIIDKKILKPNLNLQLINNTKKINIDKNKPTFDFSLKSNVFSELLKENINITDNIKQISKDDLLKIKDVDEKIIFLMDKNREIMDILIKIEEKYKKLRLEFIDLYKNINNICINNDNLISSKNEYENYISSENINLKKKLENYDNLILSMTNYINDISKIFNIKQISFIEIKQDVINSKSDSDKAKINYVDILNENIKNIEQTMKEKFKYKNKIIINKNFFAKKKYK